jgi:phosphoribosylformylglycinamidine synthase
MAITNCLNFGNPRRPEVFFQFREAVGGMGDACTALGTPVTGGNVSFYNESPMGAVFPTPTIGMVGLIPDVDVVVGGAFQNPGDAIVLLGEPTDELGASEYLSRIHGQTVGAPPACDLERERALIEALLEAIHAGAVQSAHDCSDGGLAVALAESAMMNKEAPFGVDVDLSAWERLSVRALLFGEAQGRVVVSTPDPAAVLHFAQKHGVPARQVGTVGPRGGEFIVAVGASQWRTPIARLAEAFHEAIPRLMTRVAISTDEAALAVPGDS